MWYYVDKINGYINIKIYINNKIKKMKKSSVDQKQAHQIRFNE
jgi:hypothetical protein